MGQFQRLTLTTDKRQKSRSDAAENTYEENNILDEGVPYTTWFQL